MVEFNREAQCDPMKPITSESRLNIAPTWKQVGGVMALICLAAFFYLKTTFAQEFVSKSEFNEGKKNLADTIKESVQGLVKNQEFIMNQQAEMRSDIKGLIGRQGYQKNP